MTWVDDRIEELATKSEFVVQFSANPDSTASPDDAPANAVAVWVDSPSGAALLTEVSTGAEGVPTVTITRYDAKGGRMAPSILAADESLMIYGSP